MDFIVQLFTVDSVAHAVLVLSIVAALGLALGSIKAFGVRLGVAGVLFSGLIFGHYQITLNQEVLGFVQEFGLILFVYTIGIQVGPSFISSLKRDGLPLNLMAAFIVLAGAFITILLSHFAHIPLSAAVGMFAGATTNTPSLGAAQQALKEIPLITEEALKMPGLGYAIAYPFGILGIILTMLITRLLFRISPQKEAEDHARQQATTLGVIESISLKVENQNLNGIIVKKIPNLRNEGVVISRIMHDGHVSVALGDTKIYVGDILHAVGPKEKLEQLQLVVGSRSAINVQEIKSSVTSRRVVVSKQDMVGKTIGELDLLSRYGVAVTRVSRMEIEFPATAEISLNYADTLMVVGEENAIKKFAADIGNSPRQLDHPFVIPVFVGISLGVLVGSIPFSLPGIPAPIKLGLAGGPLLVAIFLSRIGRIGQLIWYMPISANFMLRELGIVLFLGCVGLRSGDQFLKTLLEGSGFFWMGCATLITLAPILIVAMFARLKLKMNYMTICGLLAGSMTDPPALAFANNIAVSSAPSVAYATVYPLVMLLRVVSAQVMIIFFMH